MRLHSFIDYIKLLEESQEDGEIRKPEDKEEEDREEENKEEQDAEKPENGSDGVKTVRNAMKAAKAKLHSRHGAGGGSIRKALKMLTGTGALAGKADRHPCRPSLRQELMGSLRKEGVNEASVKPMLVGYEWRTTDGVRYSAREEGMVDGKVSDWSRAETSEISRKRIVHIYWIKGEDGKVKPYGKHSALKALGLWYDRELDRKIKPFVDKIQHDQAAIRNFFLELKTNAEYIRKSGRPDCSSDDPKSINYHLTKLSAKPSRVWRFASHVVRLKSGKMTENCVFFKYEGLWACFSVGEGKNEVSRANVLAYLEANKIKEIPFREFMAAVKKDAYD